MKQTFSLLIGTLFTFFISTAFTPGINQSTTLQNYSIPQQQIDGHWAIQSYGKSGTDLSGNFREYILTFYIDGSILTSNGNNDSKGFYFTDEQSMTFSFGDENLASLNGRWDIKQSNEDEIVLSNADGSYLILKQVYFPSQK